MTQGKSVAARVRIGLPRDRRRHISKPVSSLCSLALGIALALTLQLACLGSQAAPPQAIQPGLRTLTTAFEAHRLPASEAVRAYPVHLKGVVTYPFVDSHQIAFFVHDASGTIFARIPHGSLSNIQAGTLVDVQGVSAMGDFAPIVAQAHVTVIGRSHLPAAPQVSLARLLSGDEDGQWVEIEGVIHSIDLTPHNAILQMAARDGTIAGKLPREPGHDYSTLVDARVRIHANAGPLFNGDGQMIGVNLLIPNLSAVHVLEAGLGDALTRPVRSIASLSRFTPVHGLSRRIHVRGRVTLAWPGSLLCIRDASHGLCAHTAQTTPISLGETVDLAGFAESGGSVPSLSDAVFRTVAPPMLALPKPLPAEFVTAAQALNGAHDAELVELEGQLIGRDLAASDTTLMLASQGFVYAVLLPNNLADAASKAWRNGSRLRVTGICSVEVDRTRTEREGGPAIRKSFRVLLRSSDDVTVLEQPSWWTPTRAVKGLAIVLTLTLLVLGWVVVLSRRLKRQTRVIRQSEEQYRYLAQHDALTGLPTRVLLRDRLDSALEQSKRSGLGLALLMLDLDNFKLINDSLGHQVGDQALKVSAGRLRDTVRGVDTVARISGDEFVVLIGELNQPQEAELVAAKIVAALSAPFRHGDRDVPLSASVGVCFAYPSGLDADALLKSCDAAMYHAKAQGRNCFQLYTADMARFAEENLRLRAGLHRALPAKELEVHYQPIVNCQTGELTGFESLLRWRSHEMGLIMPGDFIPVAEQTGMIVPIGEWVLREACRQINLLEQQVGRRFLLSVNLSPRQIQQQPNLPHIIERALEEANRAPQLVEFEITESMLMSDSAATHNTLMQLRDMGVRLAIDDFGIGFSSLSYITRFSIDRIKIDRSFIRQCTREGGNLAVLRAMIAMAHGLSMTVVAEGVESAGEFRLLREEGCDTVQGYYLGRPVPADELPCLLSMLQERFEIESADSIMRR